MDAPLVKWLRKQERIARLSLNRTGDGDGYAKFDRGYYLGTAHAYAGVTTYLQRRKRPKKAAK